MLHAKQTVDSGSHRSRVQTLAMALSFALPLMLLAPASQNQVQANDFEAYKRQFMKEAQTYKTEQQDGFKAYQAAYQEAFAEYKKELAAVWGKDATVSDETNWVTHSEDLTERKEVDFEKEEIRITVLVDETPTPQALEKLLEEQLTELAQTSVDQAQKDDPVNQKAKAILQEQPPLDLPVAKTTPDLAPVIKLTDAPVNSKDGQDAIKEVLKEADIKVKPAPVVTTPSAKPSITQPIAKAPSSTAPATKKPIKHRIVVTVPMPKTAISNKSQRFKAPVAKYSEKWKIDPALVLAVMHTESSFNPMARSYVPAYGLMQIVPRSAGQDASAVQYGSARILSADYLYTPDKNINMGTIYLNILNTRYLRKITNPEARLYCVIAAYNTGAGNVARAFTGNTSVSKAAPKINSMTPFQVYNHLLRNLPHDETKDYLERVASRYEAYKKQTL